MGGFLEKRLRFAKRLLVVIALALFTLYLYSNEATEFTKSEIVQYVIPVELEEIPIEEEFPEESESDEEFLATIEKIGFKSEKWIVVTSISYPTQQIKKLAQIPGWKLVVVEDNKSPGNWSSENAIFLDVKTQLALGYKVLEHLPWNSYTRKVVGYLYAIQHGATYIYNTDDDNAPDDVAAFEQDFELEKVSWGLVMSSQGDGLVANPYAHFGQSSVWPRGYPLDKVGQSHNHSYTVCRLTTPLVQQGLVNGDPDVDAIYRLTQKSLDYSLNIQFDRRAPPVAYPKGLLSPYNSQNTLFHYEAFWSLLLPTTVAFRVTDIWRGYWTQPLFWLIGGNLGFYPPHTTQIRNAHLYLRDFGEEDQMYKQAGDLVEFLANWKCPEDSERDIYFCMIDLSNKMVEGNFWELKEIDLLQAWIQDLKSIGYKAPSIQGEIKPNSPCLPEVSTSLAIFHGVEFPIVHGPNASAPPNDNPRLVLRNLCNFTLSHPTPKTTPSNAPSTVFPSTLLVLTFNFPHYENIWLLDAIYRPHFPQILYCGELGNLSLISDLLSKPKFVYGNISAFSIVHGNVHEGYFAYDCVLRAIEMKYAVEEYIVLSDDVLFNFWNNHKFAKEEIWLLDKFLALLSTDNVTSAADWHWWFSSMGANATKAAFEEIYASDDRHLKKWRNDRESFGYNATTVPHSASDFLHFHVSRAEQIYAIFSVFRKHEVFLEVAVPTMATGISSVENLVALPGIELWFEDRDKIFEAFYNESGSVYHPLKLEPMLENFNITKYCDNYVSRVLQCNLD